MARKRRNIYPGYCYHVILRGNGGQAIFKGDSDRARLCLLMQYAKEMHDFLIHGFCLMSNHIHLLIEPKNTELSNGIHAFAFRYAQYFNNKYERCGHLFQGRYKAIIVQNGSYLKQLIRYIHRNPVRAGMVRFPRDYKWSSHRAYLKQEEYTWLSRELILSLFDEADSKTKPLFAMANYINLSDADTKEHLESIRLSTKLGAYGNMAFVEAICDDEGEYVDLRADREPKVSLAALIEMICRFLNVSEERLCSGSRRSDVVFARAVLAHLAVKLKVVSITELAAKLSRDNSSLVRLRQKASSDIKSLHVANQLEEELKSL